MVNSLLRLVEQGLALHSTLMAVIGGSLALSSQPGQRTCLALELPREVFTNLASLGGQQPGR